LAIQPVIFSDHRGIADLCNIPDQWMWCIAAGDRDIRDVLNRSNLRLRQFNLDLICNARPGIGPVVWGDETAGRGRCHQRSAHLLDRDSKLACQFSIDVDFNTRIIKRLLKLQVTKWSDLFESGENLFRICAVILQGRSINGDLHWGRRTEVHRLAHNVAGFKGEFTAGKYTRKFLP
jgi:hypothetical protein